jgi:hypothetical protein
MILEAGASSPSGSSGSGAPGPIADRVEPVGGLPEVKAKGVSRRRAVLVANLMIAGIGLVPILLAAAADRDWADRHFLPTFAWSQGAQQELILGARILLALAGLALLVLIRPIAARAAGRGHGKRLLLWTLAGLLMLAAIAGVAEAVLQARVWHAAQDRLASRDPLRRRDDLLGWTANPNRHTERIVDGRRMDYATDRFGYRVRTVGDQTDPDRPSILFAGESFLFGYGLSWSESIPAQVQAMTGIQAVNMAVNGYAGDQIYMRLRQELPRFTRPVAVVIPFLPMVFHRNLEVDRPHLDAALRWQPGRPPAFRLGELARRALRYCSSEAIDAGVAMTQATLRATIAAARVRGALPIILVPQFRSQEPAETELRRRVLDAAHLPYLVVVLDDGWRLGQDRHPNARGAAAIAAALVRALRMRSLRSPPGQASMM